MHASLKPVYPFPVNYGSEQARGLLYYAPGVGSSGKLLDVARGNNGAFNGTGPFFVQGKDGGNQALTFNGTDNYVNAPSVNLGLNGTTAVSVVFWMKSGQITPGGRIISK